MSEILIIALETIAVGTEDKLSPFRHASSIMMSGIARLALRKHHEMVASQPKDHSSEKIITDLKTVQAFIKKDDEHCPDYSVTKNVYIRQIQNVIDKYKSQPVPEHYVKEINNLKACLHELFDICKKNHKVDQHNPYYFHEIYPALNQSIEHLLKGE